MNEKIKDWFNEFFEFSTKDRNTVTSVSCKLFAEHVFNKQQERILELERVMFDLLSLSSFHMSFPFEAERLESLKPQPPEVKL